MLFLKKINCTENVKITFDELGAANKLKKFLTYFSVLLLLVYANLSVVSGAAAVTLQLLGKLN